MVDGDDVFNDVRLHFYLGNYQKSINEAQNLRIKTEAEKTIKDFWIFRSMCAQKKYNVILANFDGLTPHPLIFSLIRLAEFHTGKKTGEEIFQLFTDAKNNKWSNMEKVIYATIMIDAERPEDALRIIKEDTNVELVALSVHAYILMNRFDKAETLLKSLSNEYEFHPLFQQAKAWLALAIGQDVAAYSNKECGSLKIYSDLVTRYGDSVSLLIGKAASFISMGQSEEAEAVLQQVLALDSQSIEASALLAISASQCMLPSQNNSTRNLLKQLKVQSPDHPFIIDYITACEQFDQLKATSNAGESNC